MNPAAPAVPTTPERSPRGAPSRPFGRDLARLIPAVPGAYAFLGGLVTLTGWLTKSPRLTDWDHSGIAMMPNTAVCAAGAGGALLLLVFGRRRGWVALLGALVGVMGAATLFEHISGLDLGIDTLLVYPEWGLLTTNPGRMGPPAATSWAIIGLALVLISRGPGLHRAAAAGGMIAALIAMLSLVGYFFGADLLYTVPRLTAIALQTASMILAVGLGIVAALPDRQPMKTLLAGTTAGLLARRALPFIVLLPLGLGLLRVRGQEAGLYDTAFGTALRTLVEFVLLIALLWWMLAKIEAKERALREQSRLLNLTNDAILVRTMDGRIAEWNKGAEKLYGWSREEAIGQVSHALLRTESTVPFAQIEAALRRDDHWAGEFTHTRRDGGRITVLVRKTLDRDERGQPAAVLETLTDISERKRTETNLAFLAAISQELARPEGLDGIIRSVGAKLGAHFQVGLCRFAEVNEAGGEVVATHEWRRDGAPGSLGVPRLADLVSEDFQRTCRAGEIVVVRDTAADPRTDAAAHAAAGVRALVAVPFVRDGRWEFLLSLHDDRPRDWREDEIALMREVAARLWTRLERARAEDAVARSNAALEKQRRLHDAVLSNTPDLVYIFDLDHRFTYANAALLRMWGRTWDEAIGRNCLELGYEPWHAAMHDREIEQVVATRRPIHGEVPFTGTQGRRIYDYIFSPVLNADGAVEAIAGTTRDVTERKRAEEDVQRAKDAAEAANRSKDRFLAALSHELRTPLTPVLLTVSALEHDPALRDDVRQDLAMIRRNIELETKLIDDLLDVSRIVSGKVVLRSEAVDLNEAVNRACETCRDQLDERATRLELALNRGRLAVSADPARLQQVLWNVLKNAVKFTPAAGAVRVSTASLGDRRGEVRVSDSGIGIAPAVLPKIFDAFEQGDPAITRQFGGLGLGLAISKALVELHGGTIRAESAGPGQGATFIIELPLLAAAAGAGWSPGAALAAARPGGEPARLRLLVVEDHAATARTLQVLLAHAGYAVSLARDVRSALDLAGRESFDLLVTDLGLPDGTGYDVLAGVRKIRPVVGIAMSGYGMDEDLRRSREAGFAEHVVKPFDVAQLLAAIVRTLRPKSPG